MPEQVFGGNHGSYFGSHIDGHFECYWSEHIGNTFIGLLEPINLLLYYSCILLHAFVSTFWLPKHSVAILAILAAILAAILNLAALSTLLMPSLDCLTIKTYS